MNFMANWHCSGRVVVEKHKQPLPDLLCCVTPARIKLVSLHLQEAMDWYREQSVTGQQAPATSAMEEEPSDDGVCVLDTLQ